LGAFLGFLFFIQSISGLLLVLLFKIQENEIFFILERISRDNSFGSEVRLIHSNIVSILFLILFLHLFRGLFFNLFKSFNI